MQKMMSKNRQQFHILTMYELCLCSAYFSYILTNYVFTQHLSFFFCLPAATGIVNWILKLISWNDASKFTLVCCLDKLSNFRANYKKKKKKKILFVKFYNLSEALKQIESK